MTDTNTIISYIEQMGKKVDLLTKAVEEKRFQSRLVDVKFVEKTWGLSDRMQQDMRDKGQIFRKELPGRRKVFYDLKELEQQLCKLAKIETNDTI